MIIDMRSSDYSFPFMLGSQNVCRYACAYLHMFLHMYLHMYIPMYAMYIFVCMYMCICTDYKLFY